MKTPFNFPVLTLLSAAALLLLLLGVMDVVVDWFNATGMSFGLVFLVLYLFLYWFATEIKNVYLEWKYLEDD